MTLESKQRNRYLLLRRLYEESEGSTRVSINFFGLAKKEGLSKEDALDICDYLLREGLIGDRRAGGGVSISHKGRKEIEQSLSNPQWPTEHFQKDSLITDFTFISDQRIRTIVERDYQELNRLDAQFAPKSILILSGGIIEGILTDAIITKGTWDFDECRGRQLKDLIYRAKTDGIIVHDTLADVIKAFRNLVHPAREIKDSLSFSVVHAVQSRSAVDVIIEDVRNWDSKRPK